MSLYDMTDTAFDAFVDDHTTPPDPVDTCAICGDRGLGFRSAFSSGEWSFFCSDRCIGRYASDGHKSREEEGVEWR